MLICNVVTGTVILKMKKNFCKSAFLPRFPVSVTQRSCFSALLGSRWNSAAAWWSFSETFH